DELAALEQVREPVRVEHDAQHVRLVGLVDLDETLGELRARLDEPLAQPQQPGPLVAQPVLELDQLRGLGVEVGLDPLLPRLEQSRRLLAVRLVEIYKADKPDVLSVVLNSDGFVELLERGEFIQRIAENDREILLTVRAAKSESERTEAELDRVERRQQQVTAIVLRRRNEVAQVKTELLGVRQGKQNALGRVRHERHEIEEDLEAMEAEQAKITARLAGVPAGPIRAGSGGMIWPVNGPITGVFGEPRPGHMHAGLDIAAPEGTPIRAAQSGRVVLLGWTGGYGNYTCVQHGGSTSSCYAHQSRYGTSMGANVSQGQVIGYVGNTGHSFGAHLHFEVRVGGSPVNPMGYL
ncbi:MAG TPA: peptidoglycan DD-metalloendopeptidase family protein, partial [Solirubrobacteraceae bacterium]|nr:peptidoglycan DD-metalloendopeptidase family protein [Solirubrobacteraceae bacterium]